MSLVVVGSEDPAFGALPRLKCSPEAFKGEHRWLRSAFFLSSFFLYFPCFWRGPLSWGYGLPRFWCGPSSWGYAGLAHCSPCSSLCGKLG